MKIRIKADVKELLTRGIPLDEAARLSGQVVEATKEGGTYYLPVSENARRRPGASGWSFSNTDGRFIEELPPQGLDLTKPVQTRDGRPVELKFTDDSLRFPIVGIVTNRDGMRFTCSWRSDGCVYADGKSSVTDLVHQEPGPPIEAWINIYAHPDSDVRYNLKTSRKQADEDACSSKNRVACIKISYRKGEGL